MLLLFLWKLALVLIGWWEKTLISMKAAAFAKAEAQRVRIALGQRSEFLFELSPREFEFSIGRLFETEGWMVTVTKSTGDGGKDLILKKNGKNVLVEIKRFSVDRKIGRPLVMKLHSAVIHESADYGIFITTSDFTKEAKDFASYNNIQLVNGVELAARLRDAYPITEDLEVRAMCDRCGEIVNFKAGNASVLCATGHAVSRPEYFIRKHFEQMVCPECKGEIKRFGINEPNFKGFIFLHCAQCKMSFRLLHGKLYRFP